MLQHHRERAPGELARGNTKTSDIETVRRDLRRAEECTARALQDAATRHERDAQERAAGERRR